MEKMNIHGLYNNLIFPILFWSTCFYLSIMLGNSVVSKKTCNAPYRNKNSTLHTYLAIFLTLLKIHT